MKLSEHFDSAEFACKCNCGGLCNGAEFNLRLVNILERMRQLSEKPIKVKQGYCCSNTQTDCDDYNGLHQLGKAVDIYTPDGLSVAQLVFYAKQANANMIRQYDWGIHIEI